jgi:hypothetical protein
LLAKLETQGEKEDQQKYKTDHSNGDQAGGHGEAVVHWRVGLDVINKNKVKAPSR